MNFDLDALKAALGDMRDWAKRCHEASLVLVRSGVLPKGARVARGRHPELMSQHSWATVGDPYAPNAPIIDPTLWSYTGKEPNILIGTADTLPHKPKGAGSIWNFGRPPEPVSKVIPLNAKLSKNAKHFLSMAAPWGLDARGWMTLANSPVGGWPAAEIIGAMSENERLAAFIPIDVLGMVTDKNPGGLYW